MVRNFRELLALWTPKQLSVVLGCPYQTAVAMYRRESISPDFWTRIIEGARWRGEIVTADMLLTFADTRRAEGSRSVYRRAHPRTPGRPPRRRSA